jgi:hypothetical protein
LEVTIKGVCCQLFETQGYFGMKAWFGVHVQPCALAMELNIIRMVILKMNIMNANHKSGFIVQIEYIKFKNISFRCLGSWFVNMDHEKYGDVAWNGTRPIWILTKSPTYMGDGNEWF